MIITTEQPRHAPVIEALLDASFGPDRLQKTAYRLRDGVDSIPELNLVAIDHDEHGNEILEGTIRYWPVLVGGVTPTLLLGPIAVAGHLQGGGLGSKLIRMSLNKAIALGYTSVILVGDAPYYERFGFTRNLTLGMQMPGPVDMDRLLGLELVEGALDGASGMIGRAETAVPALPAATEAAAPLSFLFSRTWRDRMWADMAVGAA
ncbi:putative N-acetyltransferase YhbS [Azospirillum agricola]|uniref:GNAT family N-acetyltransferase n=1 Tax=Azospirillum agricola TaxID=1720247 RepID=UPI001AE36D1B|nr:N-acetyltransferase [Azospirillum agricola]MBP2229777.1 putative N-acetyltransferase YhbS [Azospirillum agricola]